MEVDSVVNDYKMGNKQRHEATRGSAVYESEGMITNILRLDQNIKSIILGYY